MFSNDPDPSANPTVFDPPANPTVNERWQDEVGDMWIWDGKEWVAFNDPFFGLTSTIRES